MKIEIKTNYLECMLDEEENIIEYECEMILNNDIEGLLNVTRKTYNGQTCLMYNIKEKISLRRMGEGKKLSIQDFISICYSLSNIINCLKEYSLYSEGIVLNKEYIFVDPRNMCCSVVYIPNANKDRDVESIQQFFRELLFSGMINIDDSIMINKIVQILNEPLQSITVLKKELESLQNKKEHFQKSVEILNKKEEKVELPKIEKIEMTKENQNQIEQVKKYAIPEKKQQEMKKEKISKEKNKKEKTTKKEKQQKDYSSTIMLCITGILFVGIAFLFHKGFFVTENGQLDTSMIVGIVIVAVGIEILVYKKIKSNKNKIVKTEKRAKKEVNNPEKKQEIKKENYFFTPEKMKQQEIQKIPEQKNIESSIIPIDSIEEMGIDVTENMDTESIENPYLENAIGERHYLTTEHTRIGRQADKVEIVLKNKKVGRLHAEIYQKDGYFFLMDMNSSNGTYLNHNTERLIACTDYRLNFGDSIRFANEEYIFKAGH